MNAAKKWNDRYQVGGKSSLALPRSLLISHVDIIPSYGLALDIAMGLGNNAKFLTDLGLRVVGVDISIIAVKKAKKNLPNLLAVVADLEYFYIPQNKFDVVIDFLYLQRNLWLPMVNGLVRGGIIFIECLLEEFNTIHPEINPLYLLKPGELYNAFESGEIHRFAEIILYEEGWMASDDLHSHPVANLIARRYA